MKKEPPIKKLYDEIISLLPTSAVTIAFIVFILSAITVKAVSLIYYDYWDPEFWKNIRVEAHGMLFDILVIGVLILFLNRRAEKRIENQRYLDEIDDFRGWKSDEAAHRIAGNIKRLNRNGYKGKIILANCYLPSIDLYNANLKGANLCSADLRESLLNGANLFNASLTSAILIETQFKRAILIKAALYEAVLTKANLEDAQLIGANLEYAIIDGACLQKAILIEADLTFANLKGSFLQDADLEFAVLEGTNLQGANLKRVRNLTLEQLSEVKSLYEAKLDPELLKEVEEKYPHLLKKPTGKKS